VAHPKNDARGQRKSRTSWTPDTTNGSRARAAGIPDPPKAPAARSALIGKTPQPPYSGVLSSTLRAAFDSAKSPDRYVYGGFARLAFEFANKIALNRETFGRDAR
jgi:hypothetical protein